MTINKFTSPRKKFGGDFSDSEDETDNVYVQNDNNIHILIQENTDIGIKDFKDFLNTPEFITTTKDPSTNIVDRYCVKNGKTTTKTYCIPNEKIRKFFKHMEYCRRQDNILMLYEKQLEYSGIMLDFDIYQNSPTSHLNDEMFSNITSAFLEILIKYVDLTQPNLPLKEEGKCDIYFGFIRKPKVKQDVDKKCYKDGFHVIIPSIQLKRETKKFLLNKCQEEEIFKDALSVIDFAEGYSSTALDMNCAHVPCYFIGSSSKFKSPAYIFQDVHYAKLNYKNIRTSPIRLKTTKEFNDPSHKEVIVCQEFSINWEAKNGIIEKRQYEVYEEFISEVQQMRKEPQLTIQDIHESECGPLSLLKLHDPDTEFLMDILDILNPRRSYEFYEWFRVLCALGHTSKSYKPLGEYFSKKCKEKYNPLDFEHHWEMAIQDTKNKLSVGSLHYWAKMDNPDRYDEVRLMNIHEMVYNKVYEEQIEGELQHYDIAQILFKSLKSKYAYDFDENGCGVWYEFVTDNEPHVPGEAFKWRKYNNSSRPPNSIKRYISEILPILFKKILTRVKNAAEYASSEEISKFHFLIRKNLQKTCRNLRNHSYKASTVAECEQIFERFGFSAQLDKDEDIIGVGNGILKLSKDILHIDGYHDYAISMYTPVSYKRFNPYNPITKKLLYVLRNIFPDDEPDSFLFIMIYISSCLDAKIKVSVMIFLIGSGSNGKTALMELIKGTIGDQYAKKMEMASLTSRNTNPDGATPSIMQLMNTRWAYYSESEECATINVPKYKEQIGQDTLCGRPLYGKTVNFKPIAVHGCISNHTLRIPTKEHATWRRILKYNMKVKFRRSDQSINPNNNERLEDPSVGKKWPNDKNVQEAFLSLLCYFYEKLQKEYAGDILSVPHPIIVLETEQFRNEEDKLNQFITSCFVKCSEENKDDRMTMIDIYERYKKWHETNFPSIKDFMKSLPNQFENSKLNKIICKTRQGDYIAGHRILENNEELAPGETFFAEENTLQKEFSNLVETTDDFYARICKEYDIEEKEREDRQRKIREAEILCNKSHLKSTPPPSPIIIPHKQIESQDEYDLSGFKAPIHGNVNDFVTSSDVESSDSE